MPIQVRPEVTPLYLLQPVLVAAVWIALMSLMREPGRRDLSALLVAGVGAAYLGGALGPVEVAACAGFTALAYVGLKDYRFIGVAWLLHAAWDVVHHRYGNPILPFAPLSSLGCAITDPLIAVWYVMGAPSVWRRGGRAAA